MNAKSVSSLDLLKAFADEQINCRGVDTRNECACKLIRMDRDRLHLRNLLLAGSGSKLGRSVTKTYFDRLRDRIRKVAKARSNA